MPDPTYHLTRRGFLAAAVTASTLTAQDNTPLTRVDHRKLLAGAGLNYSTPVPRSEEGMPVGNGRMGSLVWTTPNQLRFQINRADVYANNCASNSFFERHNDYCGGCAYFDIDFGAEGPEPFPESGFPQRLDIYEGLLTIGGRGVTVRLAAWSTADVTAISIDRAAARPVAARLRMLRFETKYAGNQLETFARDHVAEKITGSHTAASRLMVEGQRIALTQKFTEGSYCCQSAVAVEILGANARARFVNETDVELNAPGAGSITILVSSAASFDPKADIAAEAFRALDAARAKGFDAIRRETAEWWRTFWERGYIHLTSADGTAEFVSRTYAYYLYLMAATSRGKLPPKFNGMLWNTGGDLRSWGAQHWYANLSCYYEALYAPGRFELLDPMFNMYQGMFDNAATAARQEWGSQGIYIPETTYFDGLEKLPDDVAAEMQDLYLLRKPWEQRSAKFMEYARYKHPHSSRWNWIQDGKYVDGRYVITDRGFGPYGAVNHNFATTAKVAYLFWRRYEYTLDREFLRDRAYPLLRGAVEFYRNHPNVRKGVNGKYHIHHANSNESIYGAFDTDEDLSAMHGVTAAALRASRILNIDGPMQAQWSEFLNNLAPLPTSTDPEALKPADYSGPRVFVRGHNPAIKPGGFTPDGNSLPMWLFDLCHVETSDKATLETANATLQAMLRRLAPDMPVSVLSKVGMAAAALGRADAVKVMVPNQMKTLAPERAASYKKGGELANHMTLREGPQALDAERLGRASEALHLALLASSPPFPGEDPIIRVFPAWPKEWDARYTLAARGGFTVSASMRNGRVEFVELESHAGAPCKLRNPFPGPATLYRNGAKRETLTGGLLEFPTSHSERIVAVADGTTPEQFARIVP